jgi:DNA polymerase III epsilon subunit-like protein
MRYAVIDLETTGFSPATDRVVEAACVLIEDRAIVRTWSSLVNPGRPIPEYATRIHGIRDADVANAPPFERVQRELFTLCIGATVVAHNAAFDLGFLPMLAPLPLLCTVKLARLRFPNAPNHKNQTLRTYLEIDKLLSHVARARCHAELSQCHAEVSKHGRGIEAPHQCHAEVSKHARGIEAHRALSDALVTAGILLRCLDAGQGDRAVRKSA